VAGYPEPYFDTAHATLGTIPAAAVEERGSMARDPVSRARRSTMRDVANQAGLSPQTVSNFVKGRFEQMSDATRTRVVSTIEWLQYRTNVAAPSLRSQRSQRSRTLSVLVLDEQSTFLADPLTHLLIAGVNDVAREHSYGVLIELGQGESVDASQVALPATIVRRQTA